MEQAFLDLSDRLLIVEAALAQHPASERLLTLSTLVAYLRARADAAQAETQFLRTQLVAHQQAARSVVNIKQLGKINIFYGKDLHWPGWGFQW